MHAFAALLATAALLAPGVLAAKPSAGCAVNSGSTPLVAAGNHTLTVNSKERWYILKLPEPYNATHPYRLIFTLHAMGGNASMVAQGVGGYLPWYGLPDLVKDEIGAIFVSPNGLDRGWANRGGEDLSLISQIAKELKAGLCVDENLLFSVGFSYGAAMSTAIACGLAKEFRAVGAQSGGLMSGGCFDNSTDPIAFYGQHGIDGDLNIATARAVRDRFVKNNGCTPMENVTPAIGSGTHTKMEYKGCKEGYPVTWIEYDGGHTPQPRDKGAATTFAAEETWKFFSQFK